jgi:hypothetical protein
VKVFLAFLLNSLFLPPNCILRKKAKYYIKVKLSALVKYESKYLKIFSALFLRILFVQPDGLLGGITRGPDKHARRHLNYILVPLTAK